MATPESSARFPIWRAVEIGTIAVLLGLIYARTLAGLFDDWWNEESFSQGILLPPLAVYFAWLDRGPLFALPAQPSRKGLWLVVGGCVVFLAGKLAAEFFLQRFSLIVILCGLIWLYWGKARLKRLTFPLILLATMIPLPAIVYNTATAPLQLFASETATKVAQWFGVSVYRDGNIIQLAHMSLGVDEACSGLNSFSALMVAALLLGQFMCNLLASRIFLFALSAPLSIAVNVLRVSGTAILADYNEEFAMGFYHLFAGWLVFVVGFAAFIGIAKLTHAIFEK
jgi:exosortase